MYQGDPDHAIVNIKFGLQVVHQRVSVEVAVSDSDLERTFSAFVTSLCINPHVSFLIEYLDHFFAWDSTIAYHDEAYRRDTRQVNLLPPNYTYTSIKFTLEIGK